MTEKSATDRISDLLDEWMHLRATIRALDEAEHPPIFDRFGRCWAWIDGRLYRHDQMAWPEDMIRGCTTLPKASLRDNPNYRLCSICTQDWPGYICPDCQGSGMITVETDCGGCSGYPGIAHEPTCGTEPCPRGCLVNRTRCPDGGRCHHVCGTEACFRVSCCVPLSGVFDGDEWPADVVEAERRKRAS